MDPNSKEIISPNFFFFFFDRYYKNQILILSSKGGWTSAQKAQNNEFVENGLEKLGLNESDKR